MARSFPARHGLRGMIVLAILASTIGCSGGSAGATATPSASGSAEAAAIRTITMAAVGGSGVFGTATLSEVGGGQTQVVVQVEANHNRDMPGAVTLGRCPVYDESTIYYLNDTREGTSTTVVPVSLNTLMARPFMIHIVTAPDDASLAACGDIN